MCIGHTELVNIICATNWISGKLSLIDPIAWNIQSEPMACDPILRFIDSVRLLLCDLSARNALKFISSAEAMTMQISCEPIECIGFRFLFWSRYVEGTRDSTRGETRIKAPNNSNNIEFKCNAGKSTTKQVEQVTLSGHCNI